MLTSGWDGSSNGEQQPVGTYVWVMAGFQEDNVQYPASICRKKYRNDFTKTITRQKNEIMKILSTTFIAILFSSVGISQDAFFSNYQYSNALTNPTQMAISNDINLTLVHRSQWTNIVKALYYFAV